MTVKTWEQYSRLRRLGKIGPCWPTENGVLLSIQAENPLQLRRDATYFSKADFERYGETLETLPEGMKE